MKNETDIEFQDILKDNIFVNSRPKIEPYLLL